MNSPIVFYPYAQVNSGSYEILRKRFPDIHLYTFADAIDNTLWDRYVDETSPLVIISDGAMKELAQTYHIPHIMLDNADTMVGEINQLLKKDAHVKVSPVSQ